MTYGILALVFYLIVIIAASEVFTNAIESLGAKLKFSEGVTGSVFAAVGTAMPETMVPLVAIFAGNTGKVSEEVGVGAILGAPFMLSTLAMFLMGVAAWRFKKRRGKEHVTPERTGFRRDLEFFLFAFTLAFLVAFTPYELQLLFGLALIIAGAKGFVHGVESLSGLLHVPVIALSLLIVPIATELPEKVNSIIWIRRGKDTMAMGNITGAMVFQGSLLPAIGIFLTPWTINLTVISSGLVTIIASVWLYALSLWMRRLSPAHFIINGILYILFVTIVIFKTFLL
ncbi:MAG: sodium:calcium antiporter [Deltaproteobacteria bacterium]|nr:sodium:calcium antiporter [Deltaproteobacteria bacterium]